MSDTTASTPEPAKDHTIRADEMQGLESYAKIEAMIRAAHLSESLSVNTPIVAEDHNVVQRNLRRMLPSYGDEIVLDAVERMQGLGRLPAVVTIGDVYASPEIPEASWDKMTKRVLDPIPVGSLVTDERLDAFKERVVEVFAGHGKDSLLLLQDGMTNYKEPPGPRDWLGWEEGAKFALLDNRTNSLQLNEIEPLATALKERGVTAVAFLTWDPDAVSGNRFYLENFSTPGLRTYEADPDDIKPSVMAGIASGKISVLSSNAQERQDLVDAVRLSVTQARSPAARGEDR